LPESNHFSRQMSYSKTFFFSLFFFVLGNFIFSFFSFIPFFIFFFFFLIAFYFFKKERLGIFFFFLFFLFGFFHTKEAFLKIENNIFSSFFGKRIKIEGTILSEPQKWEKGFKYSFQLKNRKEKILLFTRSQPIFHYGDHLILKGKLREPSKEDNYNYFLAKEGILATMFFPEIEFLKTNPPSFLISMILSFKSKLKEIIDSAFSGFKNELLKAIILGEKYELSEGIKDKLNSSGLRHLTAVSGMHMTILSFIFLSFFNFLGFSRRMALIFSIFFVLFFIAFFGFYPSVIRAGIMNIFYFSALFFGRLPYSFYPLFLAGFLMLFQNPLILKFDLGFQLSFLAMIGIVFFSSFFKEKMKIIPDLPFFPLRDVISLSLSAQIFTLPLQVFNFGYFSIVGILANILAVPLLPFLIVSAFLFLFFSLFSKILSAPFYFLSFLFLEILEKIIAFFGGLPFAIFSLKINAFLLFFSYLFLILFGLLIFRKKSLPYFLQD